MNAMKLGLMVIFLLCAVGALADDTLEAVDTLAQTSAADTLAQTETDARVVVTYFHGTRRCATCLKLENYSHEAIEGGFKDELADGTVQWRTVNFDEEENEHYIDDYQLFTKALILSRIEGGKETGWKNLDQIWDLVGDEEKYIAYVREQTRQFIEGDAD